MQEEMKKIPGNGFNRSRDSVCENRYAALAIRPVSGLLPQWRPEPCHLKKALEAEAQPAAEEEPVEGQLQKQRRGDIEDRMLFNQHRRGADQHRGNQGRDLDSPPVLEAAAVQIPACTASWFKTWILGQQLVLVSLA